MCTHLALEMEALYLTNSDPLTKCGYSTVLSVFFFFFCIELTDLPLLFVPFLQLYKAADNSCLATHTHGSRINRACFTRVTSTSGNNKSKSTSTSDTGASEWRMVTVCDNKTVNVFDFEGNQVYYALRRLFILLPFDIHKYRRNNCSHIFCTVQLSIREHKCIIMYILTCRPRA